MSTKKKFKGAITMVTIKSTNINELISLLNSNIDVRDLIIFYENNYEINFDNNYVPQLWSKDRFYGVYDSYFEDMLYHNGLMINNELFEFEYFEFEYSEEEIDSEIIEIIKNL